MVILEITLEDVKNELEQNTTEILDLIKTLEEETLMNKMVKLALISNDFLESIGTVITYVGQHFFGFPHMKKH